MAHTTVKCELASSFPSMASIPPDYPDAHAFFPSQFSNFPTRVSAANVGPAMWCQESSVIPLLHNSGPFDGLVSPESDVTAPSISAVPFWDDPFGAVFALPNFYGGAAASDIAGSQSSRAKYPSAECSRGPLNFGTAYSTSGDDWSPSGASLVRKSLLAAHTHLDLGLESSKAQQVNGEPAIKVGRYSVEERKDRIVRYLKKRNRRNFNKTIKYACRKTLADKRVRIRGRFARNSQLSEEDDEGAMNKNNNGKGRESLYDDLTQFKYDDDQDWLQEAMASLISLPYIAG